jgi:hypothetical protein
MKILITIILLITPLTTLARSEITGYISNDPSRPGENINSGGNNDDGVGENTDEERILNEQSSGGGSLLLKTNRATAEKIEEVPIVLGYDRLPENTLVRDESGRIYIIKGERKIVIWDLVELWQYRGEPILDLPDSELSTYPTRRFFDNKLIRENNTDKIFVVRNGRKQHVKSLQEIADKFFGQKIYNVGKEEFVLYLI